MTESKGMRQQQARKGQRATRRSSADRDAEESERPVFYDPQIRAARQARKRRRQEHSPIT